MKKLKSFFYILVIFLLTLDCFAKEFENSQKLITGRLENGINYYIFKNKKPENKASLNLVVKVGSLMEEDNEQGIAHFMEHMAFNGTTKFEKNEMIKYLQSIGLSFGGDLNAYTSFDRTVYKLLVPTDSKSLEDGIEVLREWASEATLNSEEIEKEKKVVIEEWRLRQGLTQRLGDVQKKALFENSRYYERFPIGLPEIINGATSELVKNFYKKWYQPENISVIAVGDFDTSKVEDMILKHFNYQSSQKAEVPKQYSLKKLNNKFVVFSDPEIRYNTFYITKILNREVIKDEKSMKDNLVDQLLFNILNTRLVNLGKKENSPFLESLIYKYDMSYKDDIFNAVAVIKNDRLEEGITLLHNFLKSSAKNGISEYELNLEKENFLNSLENLVINRDSITHETYSDSLVEYVMTKESFLDIEKEFELSKKLISEINIKDLNKRIKNIYNDNSLYFLTTSTQQASIDEIELKNIIKISENSKSENLDFSIQPVTLEKTELIPGKIIEKKDNFYKLSNGIEVYTKKTDFDKDKINIHIFKNEGSSVNNYEEYLNLSIASNVIESSGASNLSPQDLETFMKGKNFSVSTYISDYEQGINISSDQKNIISALEYMSALIYSPKVDETIFNNTIEELKESVSNRENSPKTIYRDEINRIYSGNNPRRSPLSSNDITLLNSKAVLELFKEKFNNFSNYKVIIVGSFNDTELPSLLEKYFASLPIKDINLRAKTLNLNIPKDIIKKDIIKGVDKKATVTLIFPYSSTYGYEQKTLYNGFSQILDIALIENIREKIGGVYSIGSYTTLSPNNYGEDRMIISYSCDISRIDEIKKAVFTTLNSLLYKDIEQEKINSVVKNYELSYNTQVKENDFWSSYIYNQITVPNYKLATPNEYKELMTKENLWKYNREAINLKNYIDVTLIPEKESLN